MLEDNVAEKCSQVGSSGLAQFTHVSTPSPEEIKAAETTPKIMKPKFLVWVMSVALSMSCPPILICQSHHGRVTVRGVNV
jgi:hypothetical protein